MDTIRRKIMEKHSKNMKVCVAEMQLHVLVLKNLSAIHHSVTKEILYALLTKCRHNERTHVFPIQHHHFSQTRRNSIRNHAISRVSMTPKAIHWRISILGLPIRVVDLSAFAQLLRVFPGEVAWDALQLMNERVIEELETSIFSQIPGRRGHIQCIHTIFADFELINPVRQNLEKQRLLGKRAVVGLNIASGRHGVRRVSVQSDLRASGEERQRPAESCRRGSVNCTLLRRDGETAFERIV